MINPITHRTIALAGMYQCTDLVTQIAWHGRADADPLESCLRSLFRFDASSYLDVYGGVSHLEPGLKVLHGTLSRRRDDRTMERTRYVISLMFLERRLHNQPKHQAHIRSGIDAAEGLLEHLSITHPSVVNQLAEVYREAISTLGPRVIVRGEPASLSDSEQASRIRALLLAGVRAAVLWRQAGGRRWRVLWERRAILREIDTLLAGV